MSVRNIDEILTELDSMLSVNDTSKLVEYLSKLSPYEYIEILERLDITQRSKIIPYIVLEKLSPVLSKLPEDVIYELLKVYGIDDVARILVELPSDEVADFLLKTPHRLRTKLLETLPHWKMVEVSPLLRYPSDKAGSVMTPQIPIFIKDMTIGEALKAYIVKSELGLYDKHLYIYVLDENRKFYGWIDVKTFISSPRDKYLKDVIVKPPAVVKANDPLDEIGRVAVKYDLLEVPVIEEDGRLVGAVTIDDVLDAMVNAYSEDLLKFGGFIESIKGRYLTSNPIQIVRSRVLALIYLYLMNVITGSIVASFVDIVERIAILAAFLPMLADNSGNVGSQSSTFIIRSLAIGEVSPRDILRVLKKEITISSLLVSLLAPVSFSIALLITYFAYKSLEYAIGIGIIVTIALIVSTIVVDLTGVLLPLLLARRGIDPAAISAPLITSIGDILAAMAYFIIAVSMLRYFVLE